ncbi:MAG: hypothetical protein ACE5LX_04860 [Nitrospinota bacterium]
MKKRLALAISFVFAISLLIPAAGLADGKHPGAAKTILHAIEKLEEGEFIEAEEEIREALGAKDQKGVKTELVRKALTALEEGNEAEALKLLKGSVE